MTQQEKARDLAKLKELTINGFTYKNEIENIIYDKLIQMYEWAQEQFIEEKEKIVVDCCDKIMKQAKDDYKLLKKELKKQKQQMIDKACEWLRTTDIGTFPYKLIEEFRKEMEK